MRLYYLLVFVSTLPSICSFGQSLIFNGKVIDTELVGLPGVSIYDQDTSLLTTSDLEGNFEISLSKPTLLNFGYVGMEEFLDFK